MVVAPLVKCGAESYVVARTVAVVVGPYIYNTGGRIEGSASVWGVAGIVDHPHLVDPTSEAIASSSSERECDR